MIFRFHPNVKGYAKKAGISPSGHNRYTIMPHLSDRVSGLANGAFFAAYFRLDCRRKSTFPRLLRLYSSEIYLKLPSLDSSGLFFGKRQIFLEVFAVCYAIFISHKHPLTVFRKQKVRQCKQSSKISQNSPESIPLLAGPEGTIRHKVYQSCVVSL